MSRANRRAGFSLTEVLITMLILTIGLISLLTLFPYGALQLQKAVEDDRASYCARNAHTQFKLMWEQAWKRPDGTLKTWDEVKQEVPELARMDNPGAGLPELVQPNESYPVLIDPYGVRAYSLSTPGGLGVEWVAGANAPAEQRVPRISIVPQDIQTIRSRCSLGDDIEFARTGSAVQSGEVQRNGFYNWAWLIQRPPGEPEHKVLLTILVFGGRSLDLPAQESVFPAEWQQGSTQVRVNLGVGQSPPPVGRGGWVMDASQIPFGNQFRQRGQLYRVLDMAPDLGDPSVYNLELQSPSLYSAAPGQGVLYSLGEVAGDQTLVEVFERGVLTPDSVPVSSK